MENTVLHKIEGRQLARLGQYGHTHQKESWWQTTVSSDLGVYSRGGISLTVRVGVNPMHITLSWHVTMLTDRFPNASWTIWLMNKVDPTTIVGACSIGSSGVWEDWLLHWVLAISTNPSRGTDSQMVAPSFQVSMLGHKGASGLELRVVTGCIRNRVTSTSTLLVLSLEGSLSITVVATPASAMPLIP